LTRIIARPGVIGSRAGVAFVANRRWASVQAVDTRLESAPSAEIEETVGKSTAYPFTTIEAKWQEHWEQNQTFRTPDEIDTSKPKYYVLDMFPYPRYA